MKGTRQKILRAARLLFNQHGVATISQRNISEHIAISPGNLTYHFKKRDDILEALYFELVEVMDESFKKMEGENPSLKLLLNLTKGMNKNFFDYRFFMIDFIHIIRSNHWGVLRL
jgi:AcrR family transcriptional regulator